MRHISQLMEMALARYERTGDPADLSEADRYRSELDALQAARPGLRAST